MLHLFKRYRELLIVSVLLLYPFVSFLTTGHRGRAPNLVDRAVLGIASPLQRLITWMCDGVSGTFSHYVALRGAKVENELLRARVSELEAALNATREMTAENDRLKRMLDYVEPTPEHEIPARIIGINPVSTFLSMRINRGTDQGVQVGMPVLTPDGVVGRVHRATGGWADVVLITDQTSRMGVLVQRTRTRGTAAGAGGGRPLSLEYVLRTEALEEKDLVVTAGSDGIYPRGIPVGRVTSVQRSTSGMFLSATITPSVDLEKIEEVLVLPSNAGTLSMWPKAAAADGGAK